jgi:outer membrane murein-binding lipoprotein Lpp
VRLFESAKQKIEELRLENGQLQQRIDQLSEVEAQNTQLQSQVEGLEGDVEAMMGKETQIRERLRTILAKIDTIENEMTAPSAE